VITGAHLLLYSGDAEADRDFILDGRTVGEQRELWRWRIARRS